MTTSFPKRLLLWFYVIAAGGMLAFAAGLVFVVYVHPKGVANDAAALNLASNVIMLILGKLSGILLSRVLTPRKPKPPRLPQ